MARVMPGVSMGDGARLLPACTVLPGEALGERTLWGGGVPASPLGMVKEATEAKAAKAESGLAEERPMPVSPFALVEPPHTP